ncbi:MAG: hypothetical protein JO233_02165 [Candidatus Eremiobacteraeota bacterium]|nr:hypothetical protein [Candidatus Eremiobacteraeota bacterium]
MIRSVGADGRIDSGGVFTPIHRERLIERVAGAAQQRIALLVAPAGYGKSVALRQYLATLDAPFIRYDLRADNESLLGFVRGFVSVLSAVAPNLRNTLAEAFDRALSAASPGVELAVWMHAHIQQYEGLIAIDDLHIAEADPEVSKFLATLIERTKQSARWIIATRSTIDLPVASWLAYDDMGLAVDEMDLCFTPDEARDAARLARVAAHDEELNQILELTRGWPTAFTFALRAAVRSSDLKHLETETRERIYQYLAEQVFRSLTDEQQKLLFLASFLSEIEVAVLRAAGFDQSEQVIEALRQRVAFIYKEDEGRYRCHDLFRDFLQFQLRLQGETEYRAMQMATARALHVTGRDAPALALFSEAKAVDESAAIIERCGIELIEHGHGDVVSRAIALLPNEVQNANPSVLAIQASAEMVGGRFDSAEHLYKRAIALSEDDEFKASVAIRLLVLLTNQDKDECANVEPLLRKEHLPPDLRAEAVAALASAHALASRKDVAKELLDEALELADYCETEEARIRALQRIGFASFYIGDYEIARKTSTECARVAEGLGHYILAARAYSVLAATEVTCDEDAARALVFTEKNAASAARAGDSLGRQTALFQMYEIEARRGHLESMNAIEEDIAAMQISDPFRSAVILPLRAMRFAWDGNFADAHRLACSLCDKQSLIATAALRRAECALYLAMDGRKGDALRYAEEAVELAKAAQACSAHESRQLEFATILASLTYACAGRSTIAAQLLRHARSQVKALSAQALCSACLVLLKAMKSPAYDGSFYACLADLRAMQFGGYALLLSAVFERMEQARHRAILRLTKSEMEVLEALSNGSSAKRIASERGRSVHTIQAQIRNVIEKLGCSGRGEALAVARREGLLP